MTTELCYHCNEGFVVKVARNGIGRSVNQSEVEAYQEIKSPYLCPIIAFSPDFRWITMKRVNIPGIRTRMRYARQIKHALKEYRISDIHFYNVGDIDGTPVIFDYGGMWISPRILNQTFNRIRGYEK